MLAMFRAYPEAGLAGSRLLLSDGRLEEAGATVLPDGRTQRRGWEPLDRPGLDDRVEDVDHCSAAAVLIRRRLFLDLGGFDERCPLSYYEDADLAFKVSAPGLKVSSQPPARVIPLENASLSTRRAREPLGNERSRRAPGFDLCLMNILNADRT